MSKDFEDWYRNYHANHTRGYTMQGVEQTSRVRILCEWIKAHIPEGSKILDVGCGDMHLSRLMPNYVWTGLDIADIETDNPNRIDHDLSVIPYPLEDQSYDAAICSEVLEHLFWPQRVHAEMGRIIKPGGTYIVSTPNFWFIDHFLSSFRAAEFNPDASHSYEHIRWYRSETHDKVITPYGFQRVDTAGADAHYSAFFSPARDYLVDAGIVSDVWEADTLLGHCFPEFSHTIMLRYRKV